MMLRLEKWVSDKGTAYDVLIVTVDGKETRYIWSLAGVEELTTVAHQWSEA
jgi:hypothetical protein